MFSKLRINSLHHIRRFSEKVKFKIDESLETEEIKARKHPGILYPGILKMPDAIVNVMKGFFEEIPAKNYLANAEKLKRHLAEKHPPAEKNIYGYLYEKIQESYLGEDKDNMSLHELDAAYKVNHTRALKYLKQKVHNSRAENYDKETSLLYLLGKSMEDYAVLMKIFYEIKKRDETFVPKSIFDFGSGVGTVMWSANETWDNKVKEYFGVDISSDMIDLAEDILKKVYPNKQNIFFKQYFPASLQNDYDMTVSAFTLMELPNAKERVKALYKMWKKTKNYMVVVENGTNSGFNLINEARDFILYSSEKQKHDETHVFSPCPHDLSCPRYTANDGTPCNFETIFHKLPFYGINMRRNHLFSYVVFKKGPRQGENWPRVVRPTIKRSKHTWCHLCTPNGQLLNTVFTKSKHGKYLHRCVKASDWGDRIPVNKDSEGTQE